MTRHDDQIDCAAHSDWKDDALARIRLGLPFVLVHVPLKDSDAIESAADRRYFVNIIGHNPGTGLAEAIHFHPYGS